MEERSFEVQGMPESSLTDPVYQVYLERCENFITQSPPKNWNGVYEFQENDA